jgi:two-component system, LuxR family, response regulator FixJ
MRAKRPALEVAAFDGTTMTEAEHKIVAIVDDDPAVLESFHFLLDAMGHTARTFASAADFLETRLAVNCLILDHHMPRMTGLELAEKLRHSGSDIPILLITGSPSPAIVARAAEFGCTVFEKPPSEEDIFAFIEQAPLANP